MVFEPIVLSLFPACLIAYVVGATLALAFMRRHRLANTLGFLSSCLGGLAGVVVSWLCLQHRASPAFDLLPLATSLFPFAVKLEPRLVVAVGACGCSGGIFGCNYASLGGVDQVLPVDVYIPGCQPPPQALLHGILLAVGRMEEKHGTPTR